MIDEVTLWVCDKCDTHPATFCHECFKCGEYMKPIEFQRRPTKYAPDVASAASAEVDSTADIVPAVVVGSQPRR